MKKVSTSYIPDCDLCGAAEAGEYNTPTRRDDPATQGKWANLCGRCFQEHGLDTSVTERRVKR